MTPEQKRILRQEAEQAIKILRKMKMSQLSLGIYSVVFVLFFLVVGLPWFLLFLILSILSCCCCNATLDKMNAVVHFLNTAIPGIISSPAKLLLLPRMNQVAHNLEPLVATASKNAFLIPRTELMKLNEFPKHELALGILKEVSIQSIFASGSGISDVCFVSHKWQKNLPDLDNLALERCKAKSADYNYFWFDYTCVPQDDIIERNHYLNSIPQLLVRCQVEIVSGNVQGFKELAYVNSVWCQLENLFQFPSGVGDRNWTIYDKHDLYQVLPGFISVAFGPSFRFRMIYGERRYLTLISILELFIRFHDKDSQEENAMNMQVDNEDQV